MDKDQALRMALEALEVAELAFGHPKRIALMKEAITAIKQALAQPEPEPVAWKDRTYGNLHHQDFGNSIPLYTSPPKREWQGLTQEDIFGIADKCGLASVDWTDVMHAVEAKLKEKNG